MNFELEYYETEKGRKPAKEFVDNLEIKMKNKMALELRLLEELGYQLREPHTKPLEDGIFEVRAKV